MLENPATAILREGTKIITDTKGHHTLRLEGHFEDCDESEEEGVLLVGQFRRMKISVRNLDQPPRTCRKATLQRVRQALIPYRSKPVVFKPSVGGARCAALFNLRDVVEQRVKATTPRPGTSEVSYCHLCGCHPCLEGKCHTWGRVHRLSKSYTQRREAWFAVHVVYVRWIR